MILHQCSFKIPQECRQYSDKSPIEKIYLEAAKMCNHKRTIPKTFEKSLEKKVEGIKKAKNAKTIDCTRCLVSIFWKPSFIVFVFYPQEFPLQC